MSRTTHPLTHKAKRIYSNTRAALQGYSEQMDDAISAWAFGVLAFGTAVDFDLEDWC